MSRRPIRLPGEGRRFLELASLGRSGPSGGRHSPAQIAQIRRTVSRTPEVMVKVTAGGTTSGAVGAHFAYISRKGKLEIETDEGDRVAGREEQKAFLGSWHLELSAGQYRGPRDQRAEARETKLVHNIVLSMPAQTPPEKVLAAARTFAREKFAFKHRYALVLHTDQAHPHVHMVVQAENEHGQRLHIGKAMLREWRQDFARMMREQGIAANATPRVIRGRNKRKANDGFFRARRHGESTALREQVITIANQVFKTGRFVDPARGQLQETRKAVVENWMRVADVLEQQGEVALAADVRYFARQLPPVRTDKERLAAQFAKYLAASRDTPRTPKNPSRVPPTR
jgi:hypothetical protein